MLMKGARRKAYNHHHKWKKMTQCQKYPAETGAGHYYFSLPLEYWWPYSLGRCHNILRLFSTRIRGSLDLHFPSKGLSAFPHFQSWPSNTTSGDDWWHHPDRCQIEARVVVWRKSEDLWFERLTESSESFTVAVLQRLSLPLHYIMIVLLFFFCSHAGGSRGGHQSAGRLINQTIWLIDAKICPTHSCKCWFHLYFKSTVLFMFSMGVSRGGRLCWMPKICIK